MYKLILTLFAAFILTSCQKQYIQHPTCQRFLELSDKYDGNMNFIRCDTLWPMGRIANEVCGKDLDSLMAYIPHLEGCPSGYQEFRYVILK